MRIHQVSGFDSLSPHAVEAASEAFYELVSYEEIVPRMDKGEEVRGHLFGFVLKREGGLNTLSSS